MNNDHYKIFIGYDPRQPLALQVLSHSIYSRASKPVHIIPLVLSQLPIKRRSLTEFTYTRYLVPWLCHYLEYGMFLDADMLVLGDICELFDLHSYEHDVSVVQNPIRFEWPSMMMFTNHKCKVLTPEYIENPENHPNTLAWTNNIGALPPEWNHCVGYDAPRKDAKLVHFTQGIPCWPETADTEYAHHWRSEAHASMSSVSWQELMGGSVHAKYVLHRLHKQAKEKQNADQ